ncbi:MAG TPA: hypothetical protein VHR43_10855 [Gemmatimonadales bacterium]|jgi:hypothetical protein|nr:hypothetical protein [Gemmatimonadales bacterium]
MADRRNDLRDDDLRPAPGQQGDELGVDWKAAWETEDNYWQENFSSRPYALGPDYYDRFRPAYRYGFESARDNLGRSWDDAEPDLREGWSRYQNQSGSASAWEEIKAAVRDAWDRVTGGKVADEGAEPRIRE